MMYTIAAILFTWSMLSIVAMAAWNIAKTHYQRRGTS